MMLRRVWLLLFLLSLLASISIAKKEEKEKGKEKKKVDKNDKEDEDDDEDEGDVDETDYDDDDDDDALGANYDDDHYGGYGDGVDLSEESDNINREELHELISFRPPFDEIDKYSGDRIISDYWDVFGDAAVQNNFIRLTPDRQSKNGAIWSRRHIDGPETIEFQFRISGQGEKFFGDGIALWITDSQRYSSGSIHGNNEKFYGIGIVFDTFKNIETLKSHRDVLLVVNDGKKTFEDMTAKDVLTGCNMNFRYHEKRHDFSVKNSTRAKIELKERGLSISMDLRSNGNWEKCVDVEDLGLGNFFSSDNDKNQVYVGVTASTGELADNHDILELVVHTTAEDFHMSEKDRASDISSSLYIEDGSENENLDNLFHLLRELKSRVEALEYSVEHTSLAVDDELKVLAKKMSEHINEEGQQLHDIDAIISKVFDEDLKDHFSEADELQSELKELALDKMKELNSDIINDLDEYLNELNTSSDDSWVIAFVVVIVAVIVLGISIFMFHRTMKKMHIL